MAILCEMEFSNFLWHIWVHYLSLPLTQKDKPPRPPQLPPGWGPNLGALHKIKLASQIAILIENSYQLKNEGKMFNWFICTEVTFYKIHADCSYSFIFFFLFRLEILQLFMHNCLQVNQMMKMKVRKKNQKTAKMMEGCPFLEFQFQKYPFQF